MELFGGWRELEKQVASGPTGSLPADWAHEMEMNYLCTLDDQSVLHGVVGMCITWDGCLHDIERVQRGSVCKESLIVVSRGIHSSS